MCAIACGQDCGSDIVAGLWIAAVVRMSRDIETKLVLTYGINGDNVKSYSTTLGRSRIFDAIYLLAWCLELPPVFPSQI